MAMAGVKKETCPGCGEPELFDATTTTDYPTQFEKYPAFRGNAKKRIWLCGNCRHLEERVEGVVASSNGVSPDRHLKAVPDA